jgi:REP element-mobilizing transposase RayT
MPRTARVAPGGMVFHVLNRGVARMQLFEKAGDYAAFERVLSETLPEAPMRICCSCVMPYHWHLLLWPEHDGDLARFMQRLTITHMRRWQEPRIGNAALRNVLVWNRVPFARSSAGRARWRSPSRTMRREGTLPILPISDPSRFLLVFFSDKKGRNCFDRYAE